MKEDKQWLNFSMDDLDNSTDTIESGSLPPIISIKTIVFFISYQSNVVGIF